jgi:hypothetical protein
LTLNKVAYIELIDVNNQAVIQEKISLKNGSGNGSFQFPSNLPSGKYTIVAYTNWMKNFNPSYFFNKTITLINTQTAPEISPINTKYNYTISHFPESGNILLNIPNQIGFSIKNQFGQGLTTKGWLINNKGDTITQMATLLNGLGSFTFTPTNNETYKTVFETPLGYIHQQLPSVTSDGYHLHLEEHYNDNNDSITININSKSLNSSKAYLIIHCRGIIKKALQLLLNNGELNLKLPTLNLGVGINTFTLFDAEKNPVAERLYFQYPNKNNDNISIDEYTIAYSPLLSGNTVILDGPRNKPITGIAELNSLVAISEDVLFGSSGYKII